ncbi:hypothetical protein ACOSP7_018787 [Xanthoceras sorbifolium]
MTSAAILETRWIKKGSRFFEESLVQCHGFPAEDATWESTAELRERFQHMDLEDKDPVKKGGIDKPPRYFHHLPKPNL